MAQMYDSFLVILNMYMLIQFTKVSRQVSLIFKIISLTAPYLLYLIICYTICLFFVAFIVWQIWGDILPYFRNIWTAVTYTLAMFDLKTMYIGDEFMSAN